MGLIYKHTSRTTGKSYIGQTIHSMEFRLQGHLRHTKGSQRTKFSYALRKYGVSDFSSSVLEDSIPRDQLDSREKYWIELYNSYRDGYNLTAGGEGSTPDTLTVRDIETQEISRVTRKEWKESSNLVAESLGKKRQKRECNYCQELVPPTGYMYHFEYCFKNPLRISRETPCPYCFKVCKDATGRGNHLLRCKSNPARVVKSLKCSYCERTFPDSGNLTIHESTCCNNPQPDSYPCSYCSRKFTVMSAKVKHEIYHCKCNSKRVIISSNCKYCSREFIGGRLNLLRHEKHFCLQNADRQILEFKCSSCQQSFKDKGNLTKHQNKCLLVT